MKNSFTKIVLLFWANIEPILIVSFFLIFPFNIKKVFLTQYSYLNGYYNDFLTISIQASDIVIILLLSVSLVKLFAFTEFGTVIRNYYTRITGTHVSNFLTTRSPRPRIVSRVTLILIIFLAWSVLSALWAPLKFIAFYKAFLLLKIFAIFALIYWIALNKRSLIRSIKLSIIVGGTIQALIAVSQFIANKSLGIVILGESIFSSDMPGVAKIILNGEKHIRAYGTFPHPNILAGFLIISLFLIIEKIRCLNKFQFRKFFLVSYETWILLIKYIILFLVLITAFTLTFSRSAYLGLIFSSTLYFYEFIKRKSIIHKPKFFALVLLLIIVSLLFLYGHLKFNTSVFSTDSIRERIPSLNFSREIIANHTMFGIGIGQFTLFEYLSNNNWYGWQFQPVHNVYLLIFAELGFIGITLIMTSIIMTLKKMTRLTSNLTSVSIYIIISFLIVSIFDHYFWTIEQGIIIFMLPFIFLINLPPTDTNK